MPAAMLYSLISFSISSIWSADGSMVMARAPSFFANSKTRRAPLRPWDSHHIKVDDEQAVLFRFGLELVDGFVRGIGINLSFLVIRTQRLDAVIHFSGFDCGVASPGIRPIDHCTISSHIF